MKWERLPLPGFLIERGDAAYGARAGGRTYAITVTTGYGITATWSDATRQGPRLGSRELPVGSTYPDRSPHVYSIGELHASVAAAQLACERHHRGGTQ